MRKRRNKEKRQHRRRARHGPLDEEDPAPARVAADAVEGAEPRAEEAGDGASDVVGDHEPGHAGEDLVAAVPGADEEEAAGEHAGLEDADEDAGGDEAAEGGAEAGKGDGQAPAEGEGCDVVSWLDTREEHVGGDLEDAGVR